MTINTSVFYKMAKKSNVSQYVQFDQDNYTNKCLIENCNKVLKSNHAGRLKMHLMHHHIHIYSICIQKDRPDSASIIDTISESELDDKDVKKTKIIKKRKKNFDIVCLDILTKCGIPLRFFDSDPWNNLLSYIPLKNIIVYKKMNSKNLKNILKSQYDKLKVTVKNKLHNNMIFIKMDIATCHNRMFLVSMCNFSIRK